MPAVEHRGALDPSCSPTTSPVASSTKHVTSPVKRGSDASTVAPPPSLSATSVASAVLVALTSALSVATEAVRFLGGWERLGWWVFFASASRLSFSLSRQK